MKTREDEKGEGRRRINLWAGKGDSSRGRVSEQVQKPGGRGGGRKCWRKMGGGV